jgi:hypothetical protein
MLLDQAYQFKNPPCIHEIVDDEVIIINMEIGNYYNVKGSAKMIFVDLIHGIKPSELRDFNQWDKKVTDGLSRYIESLLQENILEVTTKSNNATPKVSFITIANPDSELILHTYTDMQELLGLDPIHEVNPEEGWPHSS